MSNLDNQMEGVTRDIEEWAQLLAHDIYINSEGSEIYDYPLEIIKETGKPYAVVLCTGGPHIEIVAEGWGEAVLCGYWWGETSKKYGKDFTTFLDFFIDRSGEE